MALHSIDRIYRIRIMLLTFTLFLFCIISVIVVITYGTLFLFLHRLKQTEWTKPNVDYVPKTMVLFPLRGADPSLPNSLEKVLTQDYPNYCVRFILDSADDSALPFVESAIEKWGGQRAEVKIIAEHFSTCSLKNCSLYHGIADLDSSFEAIVILDADANPPKDWLKRLVEPLADPRFPAATGLRWYIPSQTNAGSLVRYLWNAAAIVVQNLHRIPWAGSLALRRDIFTESDLLERWKHSLSTDGVIMPAVKQIKGNIAVVPSLFLVNRETCGLRSFHRWVKRQLFVNKLYTATWGMILGQAIAITVPLFLLAGTFVAGLIWQEWQVVLWSTMSFVFYGAGMFGTLPIMEHAIRRIVRRHGEPVERWSFYRTVLTFAMIPVTQAVYSSALFWLHFMNQVEWRGVRYEIRKDKTIEMVEYIPYAQVKKEEANKPTSL